MNTNVYNWQQELEKFVNYYSSYMPSFSQQLVGATEEDIALVEELFGVQLPIEYRAFLLIMGRTRNRLGGFLKDMEYGIEAIKLFYNDTTFPVPDDAVYICTRDPDVDYFLALGGQQNEKRPVLLYTWKYDLDTDEFTKPGESTVIADCLLQYLHYEAFLNIRRPLLKFRSVLKEITSDKKSGLSKNDRRNQFQIIADRLNFQPVPFLDGKQVFFNRFDAAMALYSAKYAADSVYVYADDKREQARLSEILIDHLDLWKC